MVGHSDYSLTLIYMLNYRKKKKKVGEFGGRGIEGALFYSLVFYGPQLLFVLKKKKKQNLLLLKYLPSSFVSSGGLNVTSTRQPPLKQQR